MNGQKKPGKPRGLSQKWLLLTYVVAVSIVLCTIVLALTYRLFINSKMADLDIIINSHAKLIARMHEKIGMAETLKVLRQTQFEATKNIESGREFVLAWPENNQIRMIIWRPLEKKVEERLINPEADSEAPLIQALRKKSDAIVGRDYHGKKVIAAFTYIEPMQAGFVGKIELSCLRHQFLLISLYALLIGAAIVVVSFFFFRQFQKKYTIRDDFTEQLLLKKLLKLSQFKQGIDLHAIVALTDSEGRIIEANQRFSKIYGFQFEEVRGKKFSVVSSNFHDQIFFKKLWSSIKRGEIWQGKIKNMSKSGREVWLDTTIIPDAHGEKTPANFICIQTDITSQVQYGKKIKDEKEQAEAANEQKSKFLAHISHEIRTPLAAIIGYVDLIQARATEQINFDKCLKIIDRNARHLNELIGEILDFSKVESGDLDVHKVAVPLIQEIRDITGMFSSTDDIKFNIDFHPPLPETIFTDPVRLRQILINLLNNAFKYTHTGSISLRVRLSNQQQDGLVDKLIFDIKDSGRGIATEYQESIFLPFVQENHQNQNPLHGTGLGLPLSKKLAQALGGDLTLLKSSKGGGSVFRAMIDPGDLKTVRILSSIDLAADIIEEQTNSAITPVLQKVRVLVVEDNKDIQIMIRTFLQQAGATVRILHDGKNILDTIERFKPDIVLLDLRLPHHSGRELVQILRQAKITLPIIALTAHVTKAERDSCLAAGFSEFLSKPIDDKKLIDSIFYWTKPSLRSRNCSSEQPLYSTMHDDLNFTKNVAFFLTETANKRDKVRTLLLTGDIKNTHNFLHQLGGSFATYGFPEMHQAMVELEELCEQQDLNALKEKWQVLQPMFDRINKTYC